jgi:hypothetical protein
MIKVMNDLRRRQVEVMQTNVRRYFEERNIIKANPILTTLRTTCFLWLFVVVYMLALLIVTYLIDAIFDSGQHFSRSLSFYMPLLVVYIFNLAINILQWRYWKRIEQRRFAAVQGDRTLLAAEQPMPNATSMALPMTIKLRYSKEFWLLMTGATVMLALLFAAILTLYDNAPLLFTSNRLLFFLVSFSILTVIVVTSIAVILAIVSRQQIEVTESGLTTRYAGKVSGMTWNEARLFARYGTFGVQKGATIIYELSSPRAIARWTWVRRKTHFVGLEPTVSIDEHYGQMQALTALVAAKTGLPLYDLRSSPQ